ncbi:MAG: DUF5103 domain-containing protein [Cyclobacteriaceae bacterium]|nr:DUF5103 domain-containing protein [Cyclobacteriaceae bacterium]MCK5372668.1 DUF5103 domain-containing protein [Cyclobacteriaceae bacterium]MCK5701662.1 DUF5103 domain-containing protein [Cyclobacteriaceae bacterium]
MNFHKLLLISYITIIIFSVNHAASAPDGLKKNLEFIDKIYEDQIKTAILFHADDIKATPLFPAAIPIFQRIPLVLKFDELYTDEADYYKAKIIHCNLDWSPSNLSELQYLYEYNEFNVDEFEFSIATKVPYIHFTFPVPKVKLPGNYLLIVYRDMDEEDIIISKRFIVYDQKVKIIGAVELSTGVVQRRLNQQIEFVVDYTKFPIPNPYLDLHVVLRQNHRWDNAIYGLKPTMIKEDISQLDYRHFNFENNFKAGNEFRFFDIRSVHFGGRNVEKTNISETQIDAYLYFDKSRGTEPYSFINDLNGGFVIENSEGNNDFLESDYFNVHFFLDLKEQINENIYLCGKFTDWRYGDINKMKYIDVSGIYLCNLILKQGLYDFQYCIPGNQENPTMLEGNHFETKNEYEIIVYYKDLMLNTDVIIGYRNLN